MCTPEVKLVQDALGNMDLYMSLVHPNFKFNIFGGMLDDSACAGNTKVMGCNNPSLSSILTSDPFGICK